MFQRVRTFLKLWLKSPNFKTIVVDAAMQNLLQQFLSTDELQRLQVCLVMGLGQDVLQIAQSSFCDVYFLLSGEESARVLLQLLSQVAWNAESFRVLFAADLELQPLIVSQFQSQKLQFSQFKVQAANFAAAYFGEHAMLCQDQQQMVRNAAENFALQPQRFARVLHFTQFQEQLATPPIFKLYQNLTRGCEQKSNSVLVIVDRNRFWPSLARLRFGYGALVFELRELLQYAAFHDASNQQIEELSAKLDDIYLTNDKPEKYLQTYFKSDKIPDFEAFDLLNDNFLKANTEKNYTDVVPVLQSAILQYKQKMEVIKPELAAEIANLQKLKTLYDRHMVYQKVLMKIAVKNNLFKFCQFLEQMSLNASYGVGNYQEFLQSSPNLDKYFRLMFYCVFVNSQVDADVVQNQLANALKLSPQCLDCAQKVLKTFESKRSQSTSTIGQIGKVVGNLFKVNDVPNLTATLINANKDINQLIVKQMNQAQLKFGQFYIQDLENQLKQVDKKDQLIFMFDGDVSVSEATCGVNVVASQVSRFYDLLQ